MASAGYLTYDPATHRFTLPPEHAPVLAQETGPVFFGGIWEMLMGMLRPIDKLAQTFKEGGGVGQAEYPDATYHGMDRFTAGWFENLLVQAWLPAVPAVKAALDRGIDVADVGCGRGRAVIKFVQAFPKSRIVGYDVYQPNIDRAMANAQAAGVAAQVRFERLDASKAIPGQYDLITTRSTLGGSCARFARRCGRAGPIFAWTSTARTSRRRTRDRWLRCSTDSGWCTA